MGGLSALPSASDITLPSIGESGSTNTNDPKVDTNNTPYVNPQGIPTTTDSTVQNSTIPLEVPESALPPALADPTVSATQVLAPAEATSEVPSSVGDVTEVRPPSEYVPPPIGNSPSDGPLDIVPPAEIVAPEVPPISGGVGVIGDVVPPVGVGA